MNLTPLEKAAIEAEYSLIVETLKKTKFNKSKAAELLQIDRKTLYNKLDYYEQYKGHKSGRGELLLSDHKTP
jgi:DNA-binding NtrC family response regulator